ncbi:BglII/BstYI family type II restriction endonuclease [Gemmobacter caeruleus]|uniref:BglII/BstYI family type II restriction endonuclease n=1 Tax=Gemmobacter caeruleus TaxID=2595004 RepID=UPI0011EE86D6|nr:BglII/BstYI family type II restriction endonuclease [Gemmobacter caeruleus]
MAQDEGDAPARLDDVSAGRNADRAETLAPLLPADLLARYEVFSYRNAAGILKHSFPAQYDDLVSALRQLRITRRQIRTPGGSKSEIAKYIDTLFDAEWRETRIAADLHVRLMSPKGDATFSSYTREGYLDGHRIDFVKGRVALDLEWNSKDQTYDRDLYAFSAFYEAGAIDVGIIITRGTAMNTDFFRGLGKVLAKDGSEGAGDVHKKYGASTTWMGKLLYRLDAGRNGGCPVLAIGITPHCVAAD